MELVGIEPTSPLCAKQMPFLIWLQPLIIAGGRIELLRLGYEPSDRSHRSSPAIFMEAEGFEPSCFFQSIRLQRLLYYPIPNEPITHIPLLLCLPYGNPEGAPLFFKLITCGDYQPSHVRLRSFGKCAVVVRVLCQLFYEADWQPRTASLLSWKKSIPFAPELFILQKINLDSSGKRESYECNASTTIYTPRSINRYQNRSYLASELFTTLR